jgi:hypothetical protein
LRRAAAQDETAPVLKINGRIHEHFLSPLLEKYPQPVFFNSGIAGLGVFGYVHSQGRLSAAWHEEYPHSITSGPLLIHNFLKFIYCARCQAYHATSLFLSQNTLSCSPTVMKPDIFMYNTRIFLSVQIFFTFQALRW